MVLGLGSGSTAELVLRALGRRIARGELPGVRGVPTSNRTRDLARAAGIPLTDLDESPNVDLTIDGADEIDPRLDLVKGGGGALLREKIVARASGRNVIVADDSKLVDRLGRRCALPVEVVAFGWRTHLPALEGLGAEVTLRPARGGEPFRTDEGHLILDCRFPDGLEDAARIDRELRARPGVVETGLFLGLASALVVAAPDGVRVRERPG